MTDAARAPLVMVDDNATDREIARICYEMSSLEYPWRELSSPQAFLDYAEAVLAGEEAAPVLVLIDLNMPGMTGIEAVDKMRRETGLHDMEVMLLTSSLNPNDRKRAVQAGIRRYASKFADIDEYVNFFESLRQVPG